MPDTLTVTRLLTAKSDIGRTRIETTPQACELGEGEILLRVDRFSLSANNMTYAALGETMKFGNSSARRTLSGDICRSGASPMWLPRRLRASR